MCINSICELPGIDWREKGAVTQIKNQGETDNSWIFAITGLVETYQFIKTHLLFPVSEQQIFDCVECPREKCKRSGQESDMTGKRSGQESDMTGTRLPKIICGLNYVVKNGLTTESAYPYTGRKGVCKIPVSSPYGIPKYCAKHNPSFFNVYTQLKNLPVIVRMDMYEDLQNYDGGIYQRKRECNKLIKKDFYLLVVGFIIDSSPYFICKASMGRSFGVEGYVYVGLCKGNTFNCMYYVC